MRFLDSLPDSVIPSRFTEQCLKESRNWFTCKKVTRENLLYITTVYIINIFLSSRQKYIPSVFFFTDNQRITRSQS